MHHATPFVIVVALGVGCGAEEERLGELVDSCNEQEAVLQRDLAECQRELETAHAAVSGEGVQSGPTEPAPLMPMRARVRTRPGEDAVLEFDARSYTHRTIDGFLFRARLFNAFEELIPCDPTDNEDAATCIAGAEEMRDEEERIIEPRRSERVRRDLPDHDRATKAIVTIYEVEFDDRSRWRGSAVGFPAPPIRRSEEGEDDREGIGARLGGLGED